MEKQSIFIAIGQALFAMFGACVRWLNQKDIRQRKIVLLVANAASAAFTGLLVYLGYKAFNWNIYFAFALAGCVGSLGVNGLDLISNLYMKKAGIDEKGGSKGDKQ